MQETRLRSISVSVFDSPFYVTYARPLELVISSENEALSRVVDGNRGVAVSVTHVAHEPTLFFPLP